MEDDSGFWGIVAIIMFVYMLIFLGEVIINSKPQDYQRLEVDWNEDL